MPCLGDSELCLWLASNIQQSSAGFGVVSQCNDVPSEVLGTVDETSKVLLRNFA